MKRLMLAVIAAALLVPATAAAKEPSEASISGPGFSKTLKLQAAGDFSNTALGHLTFRSGFFPAAVGQIPDPMLSGRPAGKLGPRYTIVWTVPGGGNTHRIRQDIYPYARGGAVTHSPQSGPTCGRISVTTSLPPRAASVTTWHTAPTSIASCHSEWKLC